MRSFTMNRPYPYLLITPLAFLLLACGADFEPGSHIDSPRILALQADQPYAHPGEHVALDLLYANPSDAPLSWAFGTCTLPDGSAVDTCLAELDGELTPFEPGTGALEVDVPDDVLSGLSEGERPSALIGAVVLACPGELAKGQTGPVPARCLDDDGHALPISDLEVGIKRILLREHDRNANPAIDGLFWDGKPWPENDVPRAQLCPHGGHEIDDCEKSLQQRIDVQVGEQERGSDELGGEFSEQLI